MNKLWKEWTHVVFDAAIIIVILYILCWPVRIDGISMENTLSHNDGVVISRVMGKLSFYDAGDLIVFNYFENGKNLQVIKRIIALEGDSVEIYNGIVAVNGVTLDEDYALGETKGNVSLEVPEGHIFVLGDNREHSEDSRYMGTISEDDIVGKVLCRWLPFNQMTGF